MYWRYGGRTWKYLHIRYIALGAWPIHILQLVVVLEMLNLTFLYVLDGASKSSRENAMPMNTMQVPLGIIRKHKICKVFQRSDIRDGWNVSIGALQKTYNFSRILSVRWASTCWRHWHPLVLALNTGGEFRRIQNVAQSQGKWKKMQWRKLCSVKILTTLGCLPYPSNKALCLDANP